MFHPFRRDPTFIGFAAKFAVLREALIKITPFALSLSKGFLSYGLNWIYSAHGSTSSPRTE